jgi:hypothetical protein
MNAYRHANWVKFRNEVIKLHDERCARCNRSRDDGVILQVHHSNGYVSGRQPWEYGHTECEALCKGCHAEEHGKIMPQSGWDLIGYDDLGDAVGNCELCGTNLRYIYAITHRDWGSMAVGTDCCDKLTGSAIASEHHHEHIRTIDMRKRFVNSKRWRMMADGTRCIRQKGIDVKVHDQGGYFTVQMNDARGKAKFDTFLDAKIRTFDLIHSGEAEAYLKRRRELQMAKLRDSIGVQRSRTFSKRQISSHIQSPFRKLA